MTAVLQLNIDLWTVRARHAAFLCEHNDREIANQTKRGGAVAAWGGPEAILLHDKALYRSCR